MTGAEPTARRELAVVTAWAVVVTVVFAPVAAVVAARWDAPLRLVPAPLQGPPTLFAAVWLVLGGARALGWLRADRVDRAASLVAGAFLGALAGLVPAALLAFLLSRLFDDAEDVATTCVVLIAGSGLAVFATYLGAFQGCSLAGRRVLPRDTEKDLDAFVPRMLAVHLLTTPAVVAMAALGGVLGGTPGAVTGGLLYSAGVWLVGAWLLVRDADAGLRS